MAYAVKEAFYTLQGEGAQSGRASVFCRFTGCNLWTGREADRATAACRFCDTDFLGTDGPGGGRFTDAQALGDHLLNLWHTGGAGGVPYVVFTGGEPSLQLDRALVVACHDRGFEVAIETNGTRALPAGIDWICVSPKPRSELVVRTGHELKFVFPQSELEPDDFSDLNFTHWYIQPMDGPELISNTQASVRFCRENPQWRLSLQTHKLVGIP
ncbi:MAG: 7-carboxy-7-deazaguanine synthase [Myxococcota bacterium]|nr:7-carboxy-7-deazaguanine synthase [Myxococcota bacterium]